MNIFRYKLLILCIYLTACSHPREPKEDTILDIPKIEETFLPEFPPLKKHDVIKLQRKSNSFFKAYLNPETFSGQFLVAKYGKVVYFKAEGYSNCNDKEKINSKTPLHVASVSKVATALAVLRLVDQNKIKLNDDIQTYFPDLPYKGITVKMLLNHRSGIPYYGYFPHKLWKPGKIMHNKDVLKLLIENKIPLNFPSDTKFAYSNTNFVLLALIVEKVTEKSFSEAMKELVFDPLKMKNSFILTDEAMYCTVSKSYNSKLKEQEFDYLDATYGDKNLYTTAYDLLQMDMGTYSNKFLSDSLQKQMFKGYSYERSGNNNYGLGIRMKEAKENDPYFFHTGWWHGNTACYATLRKDSICIIALSNVYTKNVFRINRLASAFGNYPFQFEE